MEALTTSVIVLYVMLACWSVYMMTWKWWNDIAPAVEAQRIARVAVSSIIDGTSDTSAGTDSIGASTYKRRNGISYISLTNTNPTPATPVISAGRIDFRLENDTTNARAFYIAADANGVKAVYYSDNNLNVHKVDATQGITDLTFEAVAGYTNLIKVIATVNVRGSSDVVTYSDYVFLRNA